jgi:hypothetical protein
MLFCGLNIPSGHDGENFLPAQKSISWFSHDFDITFIFVYVYEKSSAILHRFYSPFSARSFGAKNPFSQ